jgi:plastocyanin
MRRLLLSACLAALCTSALAPLVIARASAATGSARSAREVDGAQALGALRGRLEIRRLERPSPRRPGVSEPGAAGARDLPDMRRGVVYLETAPRGAFESREPGRAVMDQRNETFVPHVLAVLAGSIVEFPNSDTTFHNVFSLSKTKRFDLGRYAVGRSKSVRFDRPGVVRVFCDIHSHMNAFILVFSHPFFDLTDTEGRFRIEQVPAGTYTVIGWYEGEARTSRAVTVTAGAAADLELVIP